MDSSSSSSTAMRCWLALLFGLTIASEAGASCTSHSDCNDINECTIDTCVANVCQHDWLLPEGTEQALSSAPIRITALGGGEIIGEQHADASEHGVHVVLDVDELYVGHAFTFWLSWFDNPDACTGPPRDGQRCGVGDIFNELADSSFIYGGGFVEAGGPQQLETCLLANTPLGERENVSLSGNHILDNPLTAEYQVVFLFHGPADPDYGPPRLDENDAYTQIEKHDGGCNNTNNGHGMPDGPYTCGTNAAAGAFNNAFQCVDLQSCPEF